MAIAIVNVRTATLATGASTTLAYLGAVTVGSTLVCGGVWFNNGGGAAAPAISDSVNGSWTSVAYDSLSVSPGIQVSVAALTNTAAGTPTVTIDPGGASSCDYGIVFVAEVTGALSSSVDVVTSGEALGDSTPEIASGVLAQADEAIFAIMSHDGGSGAITIDADFSLIVENEDNATSQAGSAGDKIVSSTVSETAGWTLGSADNSSLALISIKGTAPGAQNVLMWIQA